MSRSPFPVPRLVVGGVRPWHAVLAALPPIPRRRGSSSTHPTPSWQLFHPSHAVLAALPPIPRRLGSSSTHPTPSWQLFHPSHAVLAALPPFHPSHAVLAALPPIPRRLGSSSTHPTPSWQLFHPSHAVLAALPPFHPSHAVLAALPPQCYAVLFKLLLSFPHPPAPPRKGFIPMVTSENISEDVVWLAFWWRIYWPGCGI